MKTKENKIKITLKTIIILAFAFFTILYIIIFFNMYFPTNKSYAKETTTNPDNASKTINTTEKNQEISQANKIDIDQIINQNTNNGQTEQITKKEETLEYLTEYRTNKEIPKGMSVVVQEGRQGKQKITIKTTYDKDGNQIKEEQTNATITKASANKIVEIGGANYTSNYKVKVGDKIYVTSDELAVRAEATEESRKITTLKKEDELTPVVGDYVQVEITGDSATIEKVMPRNTYIKRPKIANISQIIFVLSTKNPKPDLLMLDKQLVYAESLGIKPVIVVNKIDLADTAQQIKNTYTKIGYDVILTNAKEGVGIDKIREKLKGQISAFSGNSGVGKSTIINALFEEEKTQEGEISTKNKKGKNTTTDIKLYELEENTYIADTPGFSSFEISEIESTNLDKYFKEFRKEIDNCEFVGCTHIKEKECGIKQAVEEGKISQERYDRFCKIYEELKEKEAHRW